MELFLKSYNFYCSQKINGSMQNSQNNYKPIFHIHENNPTSNLWKRMINSLDINKLGDFT